MIKGIYLVKRWLEDDDYDYEVAAYGVTNQMVVFEGLSKGYWRKDQLKEAKYEALESLLEESDIEKFHIDNVFQGRLKARNIDGSKIKLVFEDIGGSDLRGGFPTDNLVRYYLGLIPESEI